MPKKHGGGGGKISARRGGSANDAAATPKLSTGTSGTTEHSSNPDRGVTASQEAELHRLHDKLCFRLEVETPTVDKVDVVPERPDFLMVYRAVFSPDECAAIIDIIDSVGLNAASKSDLNPRKGEAYLNRENATFEHSRLADIVWQRLRSAGLPHVDGRKPKGLFPRLRYYCYRKGQRFEQHVDTYVQDADGDQSEYTLLIYLNSSARSLVTNGQDDSATATLPALSGGATVFYATAKKVLASVEPEAGAALIHAHGRRCLMHEGAAVEKGVKYVFRSDVIYHKA